MIEDVFMMQGCPLCANGIPAIVTIFLNDPPNIESHNYHFGGFVNPDEAIAAHQSHRSLRIVGCKPFEVEEGDNQE